MSESVNIIARAESRSTEDKLMRSGASSVVMPAAIGASRIAQLAIKVERSELARIENLEADEEQETTPATVIPSFIVRQPP